MLLKLFSRLILPVFLAVALAAADSVGAANPEPYLLDARSLALGGAVRALSGPVESARVNPAGLGPQRGFFSGVTYATRRNTAFDAFSLTVVDNVTSPMGGAIQYQRLYGGSEREDLSLGLAAGKKGMWWGGTLRYVHGREARGDNWKDVFTGDLGALFERPGGTRFAVVGYNLVDTPLDFLERNIAGGVAQTGVGNWNLAADLVRSLDLDFANGIDLHLGAEYQLSDRPLALRFGYMWRGNNGQDYPSGGLGWTAKSWGVGYALQLPRQNPAAVLQLFTVEGQF